MTAPTTSLLVEVAPLADELLSSVPPSLPLEVIEDADFFNGGFATSDGGSRLLRNSTMIFQDLKLVN